MTYCLLVVGVGNEYRGDDGAGIAAARYIRAKGLPDIQVIEQPGEGTALIDLWQTTQAQIVYLIDAMNSGALPGSTARFEAHHDPLPAQLAEHSSHLFGVAQAVELARVLGCLPPQLIVYAIEGGCFDFGAGLSAEVEAAARQVAERIVMEIERASSPS